jgi:hypothetical protein
VTRSDLRSANIPNMNSLKNMSMGAILDILVLISHVIAGDPDAVPRDPGLLGNEVMNYELPGIGLTVAYVYVASVPQKASGAVRCGSFKHNRGPVHISAVIFCRELVTPVQRLLKAIDAAADNPNANLGKLADQIEGALNLPNNSLSFAWDPVLEDFQIRFAYQQNISVCAVQRLASTRIGCLFFFLGASSERPAERAFLWLCYTRAAVTQRGINLNFDLWNVLSEAGANVQPYRFLANLVDVDAAVNLTATAGFAINLNLGVNVRNGSFTPYIAGMPKRSSAVRAIRLEQPVTCLWPPGTAVLVLVSCRV